MNKQMDNDNFKEVYINKYFDFYELVEFMSQFDKADHDRYFFVAHPPEISEEMIVLDKFKNIMIPDMVIPYLNKDTRFYTDESLEFNGNTKFTYLYEVREDGRLHTHEWSSINNIILPSGAEEANVLRIYTYIYGHFELLWERKDYKSTDSMIDYSDANKGGVI